MMPKDKDMAVLCARCGCAGNLKCGHEPPEWAKDVGIYCALDACLVCPCCKDKLKRLEDV